MPVGGPLVDLALFAAVLYRLAAGAGQRSRLSANTGIGFIKLRTKHKVVLFKGVVYVF